MRPKGSAARFEDRDRERTATSNAEFARALCCDGEGSVCGLGGSLARRAFSTGPELKAEATEVGDCRGEQYWLCGSSAPAVESSGVVLSVLALVLFFRLPILIDDHYAASVIKSSASMTSAIIPL